MVSFPADTRDFSLFLSVQIVSDVHAASRSKSNGGPSRRVKRPERYDHSPQLRSKVKMRGVILILQHMILQHMIYTDITAYDIY
jgi:hypothetical protein